MRDTITNRLTALEEQAITVGGVYGRPKWVQNRIDRYWAYVREYIDKGTRPGKKVTDEYMKFHREHGGRCVPGSNEAAEACWAH